jgi:4-diphosphocytidyl-2-C-methyl-D-erythritol kinase
VLQALRTGDPAQLADAMHNDLQVAALHERPDLADIIDRGLVAGALQGIVSGSGPTVALLCPDPETAQHVQNTLRDAGLDPLHVHGPVHGARIIG